MTHDFIDVLLRPVFNLGSGGGLFFKRQMSVSSGPAIPDEARRFDQGLAIVTVSSMDGDVKLISGARQRRTETPLSSGPHRRASYAGGKLAFADQR